MECEKHIDAMMNEANWNEWMNMLAMCPVSREKDALRQLEKLNEEFKKLTSK